jgi:2-oxo-4-hydroxy-4-carboxy-5-ureidoimidazoline decarboxylase
MSFLERWNGMTAEAAADAVLGCCGSRAWAKAVAERRPLGSLPELLAASDSAWWSLGPEDWEEAFASHPRIGERHAAGPATVASLRWSEGEQSAAMNEAEVLQLLADGNRAYEATFGRVFLVRAMGRSAGEILALLRRRLHNTPEAELQESAEQQREITHLRLQRWLSEGETAQAVRS